MKKCSGRGRRCYVPELLHVPINRLLSRLTVKRRKSWLLAASALASSSLGISGPVLAANECGPLDLSGSVTCTSTPGIPPGTVGNPYPGGISYLQTTPATDLHVTLDSDVNVTFSGAQLGAIIVDNRGGKAELTANGAAITANVPGVNGLVATTDNGSGNAIITASGPIQVVGNGIVAIARGDLASVTYDGPGVTSSGSSATVIQAVNNGAGDAFIDARGNLRGDVVGSGMPNGISGLFAQGGSNGTVNYTGGTIAVRGNFANGIYAAGDSSTVTTAPGTTITVLSLTGERLKPGIALDAFGTAAAGNALTVNSASTIQMLGPAAPDPGLRNNGYGIRAMSFLDAPISVTYTGPGITTFGGNGMGIVALSGGGSIDVTSYGPITTHGTGAVGIFADSTNLVASSPSEFRATTPVFNATPTGTVQVNARNNILTTGQFSSGIVAKGALDVMVNVASGASINGGWQADLTGGSDLFNLPAAGVILGSTGGTATLTNDGSIGALSDRAVAGSPQVINNGLITGFVQFTGGNNSILNNGTFDLRHFADTTGVGVRDTLRVAITDLGAGLNNSFTNNGTLALPAVTGATKFDPKGQYLPVGNTNNAMALGGPLQGQLIGVNTFTNSGTIDLQSNPVAGDVLVITGASPFTGAAGTGIFISNGGTLKLDTVLNEGGAATHSDTLVVDGTSVGPLGATNMIVRNAGGAGALTVGDGILVVQVLDPSRSPDSVFKLASAVEVRGGAFDYDLFHGGVGGSNPSDWFLRSTFTVGPPIIPPVEPTEPPILPPEPPVTGPLPPGVFPIIGPEIATYGVVQPIARQLGMTTLGTLHDRIGDTSLAATTGMPCVADGSTPDEMPRKAPVKAPTDCLNAGWGPSAWGRVLGQQIDNHYGAFADPRASGQLLGFQTGIDLWRGEWLPGHRDAAGIYVGYANANVDVSGLVTNEAATGYVLRHTGGLNLDAWSGGAYWTHYGPHDWYLDAVAQATHYQGAASTQFARLDTSGFGFLTSLETGYPVRLPMFGPGFVLEPQAQIVWQRVSFDDANDGLGQVALGTTSGASGRIGLRGKWTIVSDTGQVWQPYVRANLWRDWGAQATTIFSGTDLVPLLEQATRLQLGGGLSVKVNANVSFYANADYQFAVGNTDGGRRDGVRGAAGVRYTW